MKRKKLVIISHTEHYKDQNGIVKGWGATINEINYLSDFWDEIIHIACLHKTEVPESALPYTNPNIKFVAIPPYGGKSLSDKIKILFKIPTIINIVLKNTKDASEIQLRLPTSIGLFLLPLFSFFIKRKFTFWVKYAGNWNQKNSPLSYRFQRWFLKKNFAKCKVTINGFWEPLPTSPKGRSIQPKHCISFENPCLTLENLQQGKETVSRKTFHPPFTLAFVGRLEDAKGVSRIIEALKNIPVEKIEKVHFIGSGDDLEKYKNASRFLGEKVLFHGFQNSEKVHQILKESHFFLLPSQSEGFPKVIAEAACYGTIPVVSDVGSIAHYINDSHGFIWHLNQDVSFSKILFQALQTSPEKLTAKSQNLLTVAEKFTFNAYLEKLEKYIFD